MFPASPSHPEASSSTASKSFTNSGTKPTPGMTVGTRVHEVVPRWIWIGSSNGLTCPRTLFVTRGGEASPWRTERPAAGWFGGVDFCEVPVRYPRLPAVEGLQDEIRIQTAWVQHEMDNLEGTDQRVSSDLLPRAPQEPVRLPSFKQRCTPIKGHDDLGSVSSGVGSGFHGITSLSQTVPDIHSLSGMLQLLQSTKKGRARTRSHSWIRHPETLHFVDTFR